MSYEYTRKEQDTEDYKMMKICIMMRGGNNINLK